MKHLVIVTLPLVLALTTQLSRAAETPIGKPQYVNGMEIATNYSSSGAVRVPVAMIRKS